MNYQTSQSKNGLIYHIADGVKVVPKVNGYWYLDVYQKGDRLRRNFEKGEDGLRKALEVGELMAAKLGLTRTLVEEEKPRTLSDVAAQWITSNKQRWTPATLERYAGIVNGFIEPKFGLMPLAKVTRNSIKDFLADVLAVRSAKTVEVTFAVFSGIFNEAMDRGYMHENPVSGLLKKVLPPKRKRTQSTPDPFTGEDLSTLLSVAWEKLPAPYPLILETIAMTGMRLGECIAMRVEHLDTHNCQYMVSETMKNERWGLPKSGKRLIDVPKGLVEKLVQHVKELRKKALATGERVDLIFPGLTQRLVQGALKRACYAARLRVRHPHDLRHTYASILLSQNESIMYVKKQLGHHSITMTVDTYGHWIPGERKVELDRLLSGKTHSALRQGLAHVAQNAKPHAD